MIPMRWDLLNRLLAGMPVNAAYLEVGVFRGRCLASVRCADKTGVDPRRRAPCAHHCTSDEFFAANRRQFNLVFIDGLHLEAQVLRDVDNALACLAPGGAVVLHDCNPLTEAAQLPAPAGGPWNGTVWRAWVRLRARPALEMQVADIDHGCGVVRPGRQVPLRLPASFGWPDLVANRRAWLNLVPWVVVQDVWR